MTNPLIDHIRKFVTLDETTSADVISRFKLQKIRKKTRLLEEGDRCRHMHFVTKGCLRLFFLKQNGTQQTTQFALENWWLSDFNAFAAHGVASFSVDAVEPSEVLSIDAQGLEKLLADVPQLEKYFRLIHQKANGAAQRRVRFLYELSREEMYTNFITSYPEFCQRIPQYLLASFLGITPEYLSEIRRKALLKPV
ncbi:Crp/Fnr family transcriptional regulator [Dyadobacter sp. CY326]|uniref:Crp/Fnr family transcriptional regulator n=1 Tax=Dyadobacter sp. CY326 TaxID=2907300 RepID=UPI001F2958B9|nr:Crp/Fnr family transcriptional regulator [Dyadobacter sp. CY326]MCE7066958.1 Crp/Fnr family transcriptional regulator [Dyadobacter sp. CY326]